VIKPRVLFLCIHNSARSQMVEGLLRHLAGDSFEVHSAGTEVTSVKPETIGARDEIGADLSGQESKTLERYLGEPFEYVISAAMPPTRPAQSSPVRRIACTGPSRILLKPPARRRNA
jgi:protein-tyrosine-phosphatase